MYIKNILYNIYFEKTLNKMAYKLGWKIYLKSRWNFVLDTYNSRQDLTASKREY